MRKKCIMGLVIFGCVASLHQPVMGMEVRKESSFEKENNSEQIATFLNDNAVDVINYSDEAVEEWKYLIANRYIYMGDDGHLKMQKMNSEVELKNAIVNCKQIDDWNLALDLHVLEWNEDLQMLYTPEITSDIINNVTETLNDEIDNTGALGHISRGVAHNCNYAKWNVGTTCARNYNDIKSFYSSMVAAQRLNPEVNPWLSTASYWVGFVRENGAWDYKVQKNYQTFCCTFGGVSGQDRSAEWIGNYNYGYTGKFLFDLNTLHTGSYIVSGMNPKDKSTDWPAIDKGYSHAP